MRRREFISLISGATVGWPLTVRAQQAERMRRIGMLLPATADSAQFEAYVKAVLQELGQLGWTIDRNVRIDTRWATANPAEIRRHATELAALAPDVILAHGSATVGPLLQATRSVPIVFAVVSDPVGTGLVNSLARPGGNATGFMLFEFSLGGKWLELLKQIAPAVTRAAVLRDPAQGSGTSLYAVIQAMAPSIRLEINPVNTRDPVDSQYRQAAGYIDRILKGEKPADLPVQAPTKYELVINRNTAKGLYLTVPPSLLARRRGDQVRLAGAFALNEARIN